MQDQIVSAIAVENSQNSKTGKMSATYATQKTCPSSCPLRNNGCYAEKSFAGMTTRRLNETEDSAIEAAKQEAAAIDSLTGKLDLRVHVVGDCATDEAAEIVAPAMLRHSAKHGKAAYTYCHAWRDVKHASWQGANVLASCDALSDVPTAKSRGYATALVVKKGTELFRRFKTTGKSAVADDQKLVPCPNQVSAKKPQCVDCRLCFDAAKLRDMGVTIAFLEH